MFLGNNILKGKLCIVNRGLASKYGPVIASTRYLYNVSGSGASQLNDMLPDAMGLTT